MKKLFVLIFAVAFLAVCTVPAMAASEWSFYGSSRMSTFYETFTKEASVTGNFDDSDLSWGLQGNSRIGANVKAGAISGRFEYGTGINLRLLYGTWNFGGGSLLVGQSYVPVNLFYSNQVYGGDTDMLCFGGVYDGRRPMIQLSIAGFKFAMIQPNTGDVTGAADVDTVLPKLEAKYTANLGPVKLDIIAGLNKYDEVNATDANTDITSYIVGGGVRSNFGPIYINANYYYGSNLGQYGLWQVGVDDAQVNAAGDVENTISQGLLAVLGFKLSDMINFEVGYAGNQHKNDLWSDNDKSQTYYVQSTITIAKSSVFFIVPEFGVQDFETDSSGCNQGKNTYFGLKWQINF